MYGMVILTQYALLVLYLLAPSLWSVDSLRLASPTPFINLYQPIIMQTFSALHVAISVNFSLIRHLL